MVLGRRLDLYSDAVIDSNVNGEVLFQTHFGSIGSKVAAGIHCTIQIGERQALGFLLGVGETSCDVASIFQGSESSKGLITLSVESILSQIEIVCFCCLL